MKRTVLKSAIEGRIKDQPVTANYRAVLVERDTPWLVIEQQFPSGNWGPTGGDWPLATLGNVDCLWLDYGQGWAARGIADAAEEARRILAAQGEGEGEQEWDVDVQVLVPARRTVTVRAKSHAEACKLVAKEIEERRWASWVWEEGPWDPVWEGARDLEVA